MKPFEKCPVCGGDIVTKEVEKLLRQETADFQPIGQSFKVI